MTRAPVEDSTGGLGHDVCGDVQESRWRTGCQEACEALGVGQLLVTRTPVREAAKSNTRVS